MNDLDARLRAFAAAAVLQRVRWGEREVDVPLARPVRVDPDEVLLKRADGGWLILARINSVTTLRASVRRWLRDAPDGNILAVVFASRDVEDTILEEPPERPAGRLRVALLSREQALWDLPWPALVDVLAEAARRRPPPPDDVLDTLRAAEETGWPERATPPPSPAFEKLVFALAQAHDLVRLLRGEARLRLRSGGHLTVLAATGDASVDDPALAAALARIAAGLADGDVEPGLLVIDGPEDLVHRVQQVLGRGAKLGRVNAISSRGAVKPADGELAQLVSHAMHWEGEIDLFGLLDVGLSRARGRTLGRGAAAAGENRLGLVRGLLHGLPGLRLGWLEKRGAELLSDDGALRIRWVGPGGGRVEDVLARWRLAAIAARWTGQSIDLLLEGGDQATWERVRREVGGSPEGHVFHLLQGGGVRTVAGLFGMFRPAARILRKLGRTPEEQRRCTLEELQSDLDRGAEREFRSAVLDAAFLERLSTPLPWATRGILGVLIVTYVLQLRWDVGEGSWMMAGSLLVRMGALTGEGLLPVLVSEPWRLLSSSFLHVAWWHLALNAFALWVLGRRLEAMLGPERLILLYVASCLGGAVFHELASAPGDIAAGASAGILGLLAAQGALTLRRRDLIPDRIRRLLWREAWTNGLFIAAISLLPFVGFMAHLGGAVTGFALVISGVMTLGITPATALDEGPTRILSPGWLRPLGAGVGAIAVGAAVAATVIHAPWNLGAGVEEEAFFGGALSVPVPRRAAEPVTTEEIDGVRVVSGGDLLADGLTVTARAWPVEGMDLPRDLERLAVLYGDDAIAWEHLTLGRGPAVQLPGSGPAGMRSFRWLIPRDGIVVDLHVTALPDTHTARLDGSWTRLPASVDVGKGWADVPVDDRLAALDSALAGGPVDTDDPLLSALVEEEPEAARRAIDVVVGKDREARARAVRLAQITDGERATVLSGRALAEADFTERDLLRYVHVVTLTRDEQFDQAIRESQDPITQAGAAWYAGDDEQAKTLAAEARSAMVGTSWLPALFDWTGRDMPPGVQTNLAWLDLLEGDAERCQARSLQAWSANPDDLVARFNEVVCGLVARKEAEDGATEEGSADGVPDGLRASWDEALGQAVERGDLGLLRNVRVDLQALVRRDVPGAQALLDEVDGVLAGR